MSDFSHETRQPEHAHALSDLLFGRQHEELAADD